MSRREVSFRSRHWGDGGVDMTVTRKGLEVGGHYDGGWGGIEGFSISWAELRKARDLVEGRNVISVAEAVIQLKED